MFAYVVVVPPTWRQEREKEVDMEVEVSLSDSQKISFFIVLVMKAPIVLWVSEQVNERGEWVTNCWCCVKVDSDDNRGWGYEISSRFQARFCLIKLKNERRERRQLVSSLN